MGAIARINIIGLSFYPINYLIVACTSMVNFLSSDLKNPFVTPVFQVVFLLSNDNI